MSFTDRFIKVPIKIADQQIADHIKDEDWQDSYEMINPFDISSYRPSQKYESEAVAVYFKSGEDILIILPISDFEKLLNKHQDQNISI